MVKGKIRQTSITIFHCFTSIKNSPFRLTPSAKTIQMTIVCLPLRFYDTVSVIKQMTISICMHLAAKLMNNPTQARNKDGLNSDIDTPIILAMRVMIMSRFLVITQFRKAPPRTPTIPPIQIKLCNLSSSSFPSHLQSPKSEARELNFVLTNSFLLAGGNEQT